MKLGRLGLALFLGPPFLAAAVPDKVEGTLTVIVADDFTHHQSQTSYFVRDRAGHNYELHLAGEPAGNLTTGIIVKASGRLNGSSLESAELTVQSPKSSTGPSLPMITPSSGVQKTLVYNLMSNATNALPLNFTNDQLSTRMFATSGLSVNTFYQENSFGSVSFAGDVVGPFAVTVPTSCATADLSITANLLSLASQADAAAQAAQVDTASYAHHVYMLPSELQSGCPSGLSSIGGNPSLEFITSGFFSPDNTGVYVVLAHELGHGVNMMHSQAIQADGSLVE